MYDATISRTNPGCIVFLLDRSASMAEAFGPATATTLAQGAADALNSILYDLCLRCQKDAGAPPRNYFEVAVFGYGSSSTRSIETVEPALGGPLAGRAIVPITELATHPLEVRMVQKNPDLPPVRRPVWLDPVAGRGTPMCQAIATAGEHLAAWVADHPSSYPPIVINLTDGWVTDSPYRGADLATWAQRLTTLATADGPVLLFNVFLSSRSAPLSFFPSSGSHLPNPGPDLFALSSQLPENMARSAEASGLSLSPGARGLVFNADLSALTRFLNIGTKLAVSDR